MLSYLLFSSVSILSCFPATVYSQPTETFDKRSTSNAVSQINSLFSGNTNQSTYQAVFGVLNQISPTATLSSIPRKAPVFRGEILVNTILEVTSAVLGAFDPSPSNLYAVAAELIASGISPGNLTELGEILVSGCNSQNNNNKAPPKAVYPKKGSSDAPYNINESELRAAIQIPSGFTYGQKPPVILVPGTGTTGCFSFIGNFIPLLTGQSYADPVWLNVPEYLLGDAQDNAV
jgi:hypothetical protein